MKQMFNIQPAKVIQDITYQSQNKEGILPVATLNVTQLTVLRQRCTFSEADVYIDVYKGDDNFVTSGATLLSDLDPQETYRAIDSAATGRIPSLFCDISGILYNNLLE